MNKLEIENGKYQIEDNNGIVKVYRYGELWLDGVTKFELCLIQRIEKLEQQNKRYREALKYYADEKHYESYCIDGYGCDVTEDGGEIARQALEGME